MNTELLGRTAAVFSFIAYIPFLVAILRKQAKPNRATWFIWSLLSLVIAISYTQAGAKDTALVPVVYGICSGIIFLLSFKYGVGGWTRFDRRCVLVSFVGILLWLLFHAPVIALFLNIAVDLTGSLPTLRKIKEDPSSEDRLTWVLFWIGGLLNVIAIDRWTIIIAVYPILMFGIITLIAGMVNFLPRKRPAIQPC